MSKPNFPFSWWDKTLTIYNKYIDPVTQRVTWYKSVLKDCFWKYDNTTYHAGKIALETNRVICRIPKSDKFMYQRDWKNLDDKTGHFTLATGDIIVLGEVEDVIDDYTPGQRSTDLLSKYKDQLECIEIATYIVNVGTGMSLEHYRVTGD